MAAQGQEGASLQDLLKKANNDGFAAGVAWAVQVLLTHFGQDDIAIELLRESGLTVADLEASEVDEYDLEPIREALSKEPR